MIRFHMPDTGNSSAVMFTAQDEPSSIVSEVALREDPSDEPLSAESGSGPNSSGEEDAAAPALRRRRLGAGHTSASSQGARFTGSSGPSVSTGLAGVMRHNSLVATPVNIVREELGPAASAVRSLARTVAASARQYCQWSGSSQPLQQALGADLGTEAGQQAAHTAALQYGRHAAELLDRTLPFLHSVIRTGVAGTCLTFGIGRTGGASAGDVVLREIHGHAQSGQIFDVPRPPVVPSLLNTTLNMAVPLALGAAGGALGSLLTEFLGMPLANLICRQFHPIDSRAVVPDSVVQDMNTLSPGAGDDLRQAVGTLQRDITLQGSESNVRLGQTLFSLTTAARWAALETTPLGVPGQISAGLLTAGTAGMLVGAAMGIRQSTATLRVPDQAQLRALVASAPEHPAEALAQLMKATAGPKPGAHEVPLFYARHMRAVAGASMTPRPDAMAPAATTPDTATSTAPDALPDTVVVTVAEEPQRGCMERTRSALLAVGQLIGAPGAAVMAQMRNSPLLDPQPSVEGAAPRSRAGQTFHTSANVLASGLRRGQAMFHANWRMVGIGTATSALAQPLSGWERRAMLALGNALGIHTAIRPWFTAASGWLPSVNRQMGDERQAVVNAQARSRPVRSAEDAVV